MEYSADEILETIGQFDIEGWSGVKSDQIKVTKIGDGYINTTFKVEITDERKKNEQVVSLIYKVYGGNTLAELFEKMAEVNSPLIQSVIALELSNRRWGPRVFGLVDKPQARIEEFIECHTLKSDEAFDNAVLSADLARAYARFHSLELPLPKKQAECFISKRRLTMEAEKQNLIDWLSKTTVREEHQQQFDALLDFDIVAETDWLIKNSDNISQRVVLSTSDPNYLNRLVRTKKLNDPELTQCLIIDFDLSAYLHRGTDLGGHFVFRLFDWAHPENKVTGAPLPTESERTHFLRSYLAECERLFPDFDGKSLDSLENVSREVTLNGAVMLMFVVTFFLNAPAVYDSEPVLFTAIKTAINSYKQMKSEYCTKYSQSVCN